jgi:hypothetical protein
MHIMLKLADFHVVKTFAAFSSFLFVNEKFFAFKYVEISRKKCFRSIKILPWMCKHLFKCCQKKKKKERRVISSAIIRCKRENEEKSHKRM